MNHESTSKLAAITAKLSIPDAWLTPEEVAELTCYAPATLANLRNQGRGPSYRKLGEFRSAKIRYRVGDVLAWMQSQSEPKLSSAVRVVSIALEPSTERITGAGKEVK